MINSLTKILDCTLRDGGYVNNWEFSDNHINKIITSLIISKVEIIECGFISQTRGNLKDSTQFKDISQVNDLLKSLTTEIRNTKFCVMINRGEYDLQTLPVFDPLINSVSGIRYAFHKKDWKEAVIEVEILIEKGYEVYVQPMITMSYNDSEIIEMINQVNKLDIYAMYIVDSFGAMYEDDFTRLHYLFENNLKPNVNLGYHSHNNLQLAYSNAIDFVKTKEISRPIILDSSIHGMGRGAGNLTTELVADYLNKKRNSNYNIIPLLEAIDKYLSTIYKENYWGYSIAHYLSASFECHPNYSTYLINTNTLSVVDIQKILSQLIPAQKESFSKTLIKDLYINYKSKSIIEENISFELFTDKSILVIASGPNSFKQKEIVDEFISNNNPLIIAVNHVPENYKIDYCFFSNQKRFDNFNTNFKNLEIIITSNLKDNNDKKHTVVDYQKLVGMSSNKNDNVSILLLNLLKNQKVKNVSFAGFDGYNLSGNNYSYKEYDRTLDKKVINQNNENIKKSLTEIKKEMTLNFITDSIFS